MTANARGLAPAVFRGVNDRIRELVATWGAQELREFICECSSSGCSQAVRLTTAEYDVVRAQRAHYVVAPLHEPAPAGRVVAANPRYAVVERAG